MEARVVLVSVDESLARRFREDPRLGERVPLDAYRACDDALLALREPGRSVDIAVIGADVDAPLRVAQAIHSVARDVALVFLSTGARIDALRQAALVSPFLGGELTCVVSDEPGAAVDAVVAAVSRAQRLRRHRALAAFAEQSLGQAPAKRLAAPLLERLLDHAPIGILALDAEGRVCAVNPSASRLFGVAERVALGLDLISFVADGERARLAGLIEQAFRVAGGGRAEVFEAFRGDRYHEITLSAMPADAGGGALALVQDVTERERAKRVLQSTVDELEQRVSVRTGELTRSLAMLRATLESTADGVLVVDGQGRISDFNQRFVELWRLPARIAESRDDQQAIAFVLDQLTDPEGFVAKVRDLYQQPERESFDILGFKDGRVFERYSRPLLVDGEPSGRVWSFRDITERKRMQARLLLTDRMASLGTLAAGVAHEINNPLAYVTANLEMIAEETRKLAGAPPSSELREILEMVDQAREGCNRVRKIVRGMKTFSRADEERRTVLDLHRVLELAINMSFNEVRHRARLVKDYGTPPRVEADESRLAQVFINLIVNAAQAIPEGHVDRNEIRLTTRTDAAGRAVVEVRDTGAGISEELLGRIFDPFLTTKPVGVGTGLGLSICHGIVASLEGEISVESELGRGSTFCVALPAAVAAVEPAAATARPPQIGLAARRARVLVVDDDPLVAASLRRVLNEHDVTLSNGGREALSRLVAGDRYDVVLCDLMMPDMSGMALHGALAGILPDQLDRLIFMTGGAFTPAARAFLDGVENEYFEKPFEAHNVRALVRRALRQPFDGPGEAKQPGPTS